MEKKRRRKKRTRPRAVITDWMEPIEGFPGTFTLIPERYEVIVTWARNGLTKDEIASNMGISRSTLNTWEKKCPDIKDALKEARAYAHARVENALFKKAIGFTIVERQPVKRKVAEYDGVGKKIGEHEEIDMVEVVKEVPPDMGAIAFYLKNNMPDKYRDKWPDAVADDEDMERENMCLKTFTNAVARAVIRESDKT